MQPVVHEPRPVDVAEQNVLVRQAVLRPNEDLVELQTSLRTLRLSNDVRSLLLERTQSELAASNARVTLLEETVTTSTLERTEAVNACLFAQGIAVDLNSQLLISEFNRVHLQDVLNQSVATMSNQRNQSSAENEALLLRLQQAELELKCTQEKATADATATLNTIAELQDQLKKLEARRVSDIAAAKNNCQREYQTRLNVRLQRMVPISDANKWKAAFEKEKSNYVSLSESVNSRIEEALTTLCDEHNSQLPQILEDYAREMTAAHVQVLSDRDAAIAKLDESLETVKKELTQTRKEIKQLACSKELLVSKLNAITCDTTELRNQLASCEKSVNSKDDLCNELKAALVTLERKYEAAQDEFRKSSLELESQSQVVKQLQDSLANGQDEIAVLKSTLSHDKKAIFDKDAELDRLNAAISKTLCEKEQGKSLLIKVMKGLTHQLVNRRGDIKIVALALTIGNLCRSVDETSTKIHKLKSQRKSQRIPRRNHRLIESDDEADNAMVFTKPPDKVGVGDESPASLDFHLGW